MPIDKERLWMNAITIFELKHASINNDKIFYFVKSVRNTCLFCGLLSGFMLFQEQQMQVQHFHSKNLKYLTNMRDKVLYFLL